MIQLDEVIKGIAEMMAISARTAPKAAGKDYVVTKVISSEDELEQLGKEMAAYGEQSGRKNFDRDGESVKDSAALLLVGLKGARTTGLNCGACGNDSCAELEALHEGPEFQGPYCAWRLIDLGIALGSAVKTASLLNVDNRIMYRIGVAARKAGFIDADIAVGIPLSATGKNIYFDR